MKNTDLFDAPPLPDLKKLSGQYALNVVFRGAGPKNRVAYGLVVNFIRLVEQAALSYCTAWQAMSEFAESDGSMRWGKFRTGCTHFELCVQCIRRSIGTVKALSNYESTPATLKELLPAKATVLPDSVSKLIIDFRNACQHLDNDLAAGKIVDGETIALVPGKTSLDLGKYHLDYSLLVDAIVELQSVAECLANYRE